VAIRASDIPSPLDLCGPGSHAQPLDRPDDITVLRPEDSWRWSHGHERSSAPDASPGVDGHAPHCTERITEMATSPGRPSLATRHPSPERASAEDIDHLNRTVQHGLSVEQAKEGGSSRIDQSRRGRVGCWQRRRIDPSQSAGVAGSGHRRRVEVWVRPCGWTILEKAPGDQAVHQR